MQVIINVLKGFVIGLANIIPGVSGGTLMVSMNVYDKIIDLISHFFSRLKSSLAFLLPIVIGMLIAIVAGSFGISFIFEQYPVVAKCLFIGLVLGGLPAILKKIKGKKIGITAIFCMALFFLLIIWMTFGSPVEKNATVSFDIVGIITLFVVGIIAAATMVVPGVAGSMVLLIIGYYNLIVSTVSNTVLALKDADLMGFLNCIKILIPFGIGVIVGIFAVAKALEYLFKKFPTQVYCAIIGLLVASPIAILANGGLPGLNLETVVCGILALLVGIIVSMKLGEK